jgi:hypothetical protein
LFEEVFVVDGEKDWEDEMRKLFYGRECGEESGWEKSLIINGIKWAPSNARKNDDS